MYRTPQRTPSGPQPNSTVFPIGTIMQKRFVNGKFHEGKVTSFDIVNQYYQIKYRDSNSEEFDP